MAIISWVLLVVSFLILARLCIFKVPDVQIGIPSSLFTGRFKKEKQNGNSIPIRQAYYEGVHLKLPWWSIENKGRKMVTLSIDRQSYQVGGKEGTQGSVDITGIIQYRISQRMAYRRLEVSESDIKEGLESEFDFLLGKKLGNPSIKIEEVITMKGSLSNTLFNQLRRLNSEGIEFPDDNWCGKELNGESITWSEQRFGIEILKVNINRIDPSGDLKDERDKRQKEIYQRESQTIEWNHLLARAADLKKKNPRLSSKEVWEIIQTWQKDATREIIDINAPDAISAAIGVLAKVSKKGE